MGQIAKELKAGRSMLYRALGNVLGLPKVSAWPGSVGPQGMREKVTGQPVTIEKWRSAFIYLDPPIKCSAHFRGHQHAVQMSRLPGDIVPREQFGGRGQGDSAGQ